MRNFLLLSSLGIFARLLFACQLVWSAGVAAHFHMGEKIYDRKYVW